MYVCVCMCVCVRVSVCLWVKTIKHSHAKQLIVICCQVHHANETSQNTRIFFYDTLDDLELFSMRTHPTPVPTIAA